MREPRDIGRCDDLSVIEDEASSEQLTFFDVPAQVPVRRRFHPRSLARVNDHEGGAFDYAMTREVFLGRTGIGPLRIGIDTNVLIDYEDFGASIWEAADVAVGLRKGQRRREIEALADLVNLWMIRDIRFHAFDEHLKDFKKPPSRERYARRSAQVSELVAALETFNHGSESPYDEDGEVSGDGWPVSIALDCIPGLMDRVLVTAAIEAGCHVFLTNDRQVLAKAPSIAVYGLTTMSPSMLMDSLRSTGQTGWTVVGRLLAPDIGKWSSYLMRVRRDPDDD